MNTSIESIDAADSISRHLIRRSLEASHGLCGLVVLFAVVTVAAATVDLPPLAHGQLPLPALPSLTAAGLTVLALAILATPEPTGSVGRHALAIGLALPIQLVGLLVLGEHLFEQPLGIDWMFSDDASVTPALPILPGAQTSLNFTLLAGAIILSNLGVPLRRIGHVVAIVGGTIAIAAATESIGHLFPLGPAANAMPAGTALAFLLLAVALLCRQPTVGMTKLAASETRSGAMAKWILLAIIAAPPCAAAVSRLGVGADWYSIAGQRVVFAILLGGVLAWTIWQTARRAEREERQVLVTVRELEQTNRQLGFANDRMTQQNDTLTSVGEARARFLANVSHELRTPLTLMLGPLERQLSESRGVDDDLRRDLGVIEQNARTVLGYVNDLLDVSRIEAGHVTRDDSPVDAAALVRVVGRHFSALAEERRIEWVVDAPTVLRVQTDAEKLQRIAMNLLSNAFNATPAGGRVRISLREQGERFRLEVGDSGPGIPADKREAVFERFEQLGGPAPPRRRGTGLGLSIVREFVTLLGGTVSIGDAPEHGALVTVDLPVEAPSDTAVAAEVPEAVKAGCPHLAAIESRKAPAAAAPSEPRTPGGPDRVLVVEDNQDLNRFICDCLRIDGYQVASAFDGAEAFDKIMEEHPDLVLTDIEMPGMSGDELVRGVRERPEFNSMPIIALTAKTDEEATARLLHEGVQDCVDKPFSVAELRTRVRSLVARKHADDQSASLQRRLEAVTIASAEIAQAVASLPGESVQTVFQTIALNAQNLTGATYAAAAIGGDATHPFDIWAVVGMSDDEIAAIGRRPGPVGLLGVVAKANKAVRLRDLREHPSFHGFPPGHPDMRSFLGVPVRYRGHAVGNLYLANKAGGAEFTEEDQQIVELLAARAGVAIETAKLYAAEGQAHAWLQAVIDQMPEGIILMDSDGHVTMENQSLAAFTNRTASPTDRFASAVPIDLRLPSGLPLAADDLPIVKAIGTREITRGRELIGKRRDESQVPLLVSAAPIIMADGRLAGASMVIQDITPLKQLEHLREEWASIVAHDLRQPISVIALRTALLLRAGVGDQQREDIRQIRTAAESLSRMASDLMDVSLLDTRRMQVMLERLDLGELLEDVVERVPLAARRTRVRTPSDVHVYIKGDAQRLEQIVGNLLTNAVKYGSADTEIGLEMTHGGGHAEITVTNRGAGIPADDLPFVFERYSRSRAAQAGATTGLGLGLNIAKGLVEAHGGRIWAENVPGGITAFHVALPLDGRPVRVVPDRPSHGTSQSASPTEPR